MSLDPEALVSDVIGELEIGSIPDDLRAAIEKHQVNLLSLATTLIYGGQTEAVVRKTIDTVFQSYRDELSATILAIREREADHAT